MEVLVIVVCAVGFVSLAFINMAVFLLLREIVKPQVMPYVEEGEAGVYDPNKKADADVDLEALINNLDLTEEDLIAGLKPDGR